MKRVRLALIVALAPALLAAADPTGDVAPCPHVDGVSALDGAPDLVEATGEVVELGTSVRFTLRFAEALEVPDTEGKPFRVDVVLRDPHVPAVDAGLYRDVNRLLRYDAVARPVTTILLLPEGGQSRFNPPVVEGRSIVVQVPGRTLTQDEDETGTDPALGRVRWAAVVRDEGACDLLGSGRPTERLAAVGKALPGEALPADARFEDRHDARAVDVWTVTVAALVLAAAGGLVVRRLARHR